MDGIVLCGHGSRSKAIIKNFSELACAFGVKYPECVVTYAFLEIQKPTFAQAVDYLVNVGVNKIYVVPVFLFNGLHNNYDIPGAFNKIGNNYSNVTIQIADKISGHRKLFKAIEEAVVNKTGKNHEHDWSDTILVLTGVGASILNANSNIAKIKNHLHGKYNFRESHYALLSSSENYSLDKVLSELRNKEIQHVLVVPLLLFEGYYSSKIEKAFSYLSKNNDIPVTITHPFGNDTAILDILDDRLIELRNNNLNLIK